MSAHLRTTRTTISAVNFAMGTRTPAGLSTSARQLYGDITTDYELEPFELALLTQACRLLTTIEKLEAEIGDRYIVTNSQGNRHPHPAIRECRSLRLAFMTILRQLGLGEDNRVAQRNRKPRKYGIRGAV
jgi:hypothetical protein